MVKIAFFFLSLFSFNLTNTTQNIERAFLLNDPGILLYYFPEKEFVQISMPPPISYSDLLSSQQAFFLFKKIFRSYFTSEFYSYPQVFKVGHNTAIFRGRWSFKDRLKTNHVFNIYFYLKNDPEKSRKFSRDTWIISEIRVIKVDSL